MKMIKGSIVAMITPFHEDGSVNFEKIEEMIEFQISHSTDGILVLGTTGESTTMTHEEDDQVAQFTIEKVRGRVPVIVGAGSNSTQTQLEKSIKYSKMGADALLLISPYYNKTNTEGMIQHFKVCADQASCPSILYNIPGRTGCAISEDVVKVLSKHPNICGIKEASGNISYATNIARYLNDDFAMYSGNDDMITSMLSIGASGVISVLSNILPQETHDMVSSFHQGDVKRSLDLQLQYLDVIHALFCEVNPIPVKAAMNLMGMQVGGYRLPLCEMDSKNLMKLQRVLQEQGLCE
ncbi:4-hydroxy-tetrahydrodipicolinate synthase [Faecalicoccus acidiformans]|uniref:4-hydroxy-tetrahydrodipicolinate synthase n=1 Tax=Faecalicoccus acidiformans TaxID=915173 RepID=A0A7W8D213_9FIRM|nr:4-hydroxy-tetrahydrodipicolinate synthase [Faecalicoccus acidiformans]MBB5184548.1 4-hydroxy-tetrahydrodipicolinate synthase [Faecalicoccus acidiformans]